MNLSRISRQAFIGLPLLFAAPASAADFASVVRAVLDYQSDGPLTEMEPARRSRMTDCVVQTLDALPTGLKRKIADAPTIEEQEHAFGQVVDADRAKWRQTIARECGHIAVED